jgi:hypothetical protein
MSSPSRYHRRLHMQSYQLALPEKATERIERLLTEVCPVHIGTTLDGGQCPICTLEDRGETVFTSPWVTRAASRTLPAKQYR